MDPINIAAWLLGSRGRWRPPRWSINQPLRCSDLDPPGRGCLNCRATREAWAAKVPPSVTTAAAIPKSGIHAGAVAFAPDDTGIR
jgi:hypothetical protein